MAREADVMNARRDNRNTTGDIVIQLDTPEELVAPDPHHLLTGSGRLDSGLEELVDRFLAQKKHARSQRVVLELADECPEQVAANMVLAVRHYCQLRIQRASRQQALVWRQGMGSLLSGSLLFVLGVLLSYGFTRPEVGELSQELLGNGVFLVVAWVGLWYPLDLLFVARGQVKRERRVLTEMLTVPVVVLRSDGGSR
jgi:hypothetical protein